LQQLALEVILRVFLTVPMRSRMDLRLAMKLNCYLLWEYYGRLGINCFRGTKSLSSLPTEN
ncbi:MAG: hypothetical protein ACKPCM_04200, partial [Pseudanabaena sp.]